MKHILLVGQLIVLGFCFGQNEANKWVVSPNSLIDFSSGTAVLTGTPTNADFSESSTCISDENENLLFYSDGETVWGADNNILPNGSNLSPATQTSLSTCTQGSLFVNKPGAANKYYLFSLAFKGNYRKLLSYSELDRTLNSGLGDVISKQNILIADSLAEKMVVTQHCNKRDFWLVVVKYNFTEFLPSSGPVYTLEFLSYLISPNGVNSSPIKSIVEADCPIFGQMKFNNTGNELAFAGNNTLVLCSFNTTSGKVKLNQEIDLPLENSYGIEYAPNDSLLYINEKQYNLHSNILTTLNSYQIPTQLQRSIDGKIYCFGYPENEPLPQSSTSELFANGWFTSSNSDATTHLTAINQPSLSGTACQYTPNTIAINHPGNNRNYITLPYIAAYHFNHKPSDFNYTGSCVNTPIDFFLTNDYTGIDSLQWIVPDLNLFNQNDTATFSFPNAGKWVVECTVFQNGKATTSTQCVSVCGKGSVALPEYIDLCEVEPFEINPLTPCGISYEWNTGDTTSALFIQSEGTYTLEVQTECGIFSDTMIVEKSENCTVFADIPNVITVNNDGTNDFFTIRYKNAVSFEYSIVNRWGNLLKKGSISVPASSVFNWNNTFLWNGMNKSSRPVKDGVYFYRIVFSTYNNSQVQKTGFIQVIN